MSKQTPHLAVLTANRLSDGIVVFLDGHAAWVEQVEAAAVARSPEAAHALEARAAEDAARNLVVDPYLIEMREVAGRLEPIRTRERVRIGGPSILGDVIGYTPPASKNVPSLRARAENHGEGQSHGAGASSLTQAA
jgi:hypothetical protein